jgi:hypothetical protein
MTLPTSGPLSLSDIQAEFGGNAPTSLSEYYKGGPYVGAGALAPNVPTSGPISISNFYGAQAYVPISRTITLSNGQIWTVPTTIQGGTITATLIGAAGAQGGADAGHSPYPGYPGSQVVGVVNVSPGDKILASLGGSGNPGGSGSGTGAGGGGNGGALGFSGGNGGQPGYSGWSGAGGGGGGATAIKRNNSIVAVAAGGAGGGGAGLYSNGQPQQGYNSSGSFAGGAGQSKGGDGAGGGGGGGGYLGGAGGATRGGDDGAFSGSNGADLIPPGGSSSPATTVSVYPTSYPVWCGFLNTYGVWNGAGVGQWTSVTYTVYISSAQTYQVVASADNHIRVIINGTQIVANDNWATTNSGSVSLTEGIVAIECRALNDEGPAGFAAALYNASGGMVWNTQVTSTPPSIIINGVW